MTGFLYKQFRQNWVILLISVLVPNILLTGMLLLASIGDESTNGIFASIAESGISLRLMFTIFGYIISGMLLTATFNCDELKKWIFFSASTPKGAKGLIYSKYVMLFMAVGITNIISTLVDTALCSACKAAVGVDIPSLSSIINIMFYFQLISIAFELPFVIRFGSKAGNAVKGVALFGGLFILIVYLLFGPLPGNFDELIEHIINFMDKLSAGEMPSIVMIVIGMFPVAAVGGYLLSYRISSKSLLKGVDSYDK